MITEQLSICKKTGTYSDALVALGLADLIDDIGFQAGVTRNIEISDEDEVYIVKMSPGFHPNELENWKANPGFPYIKVKQDDPEAPIGAIDYEKEKDLEKNYRQAMKVSSKKRKKEEQILKEQGLEGLEKPRHDISVLKTFNSMRMGSDAYNNINKAIATTPSINKLLGYKLSFYGLGGDYKKQGIDDNSLQKITSSLQLFNPVSGKGVNRPKPDSASPASISAKFIDWFEEWMKYRAMHKGLISNNCGSDGKDTKVMVIAPGNIDIRSVSVLRDKLLEKRFWGETSAWIDIQAILLLSRTLIEYSEELGKGKTLFRFSGQTLDKIVRGFYSAYFKNLGTASAVMNVSFLGLPGWLPVENAVQAENWLAILEEHERCLKSLDERHSSDAQLLLSYRDFLSSGDWMEFLDFLALYAVRYMQRKAQNKWVEAFTTTNLRRLFMNSTKEIIENPGFQNIATAIRKATINAQIRKAMTGKSPFEIHYGLAQNWKRKAKFKHEFISELSDFVQEYNNENARHAEQGKETRKNITTTDLKQVIDLIETEKFGSELVCMLLLAFGYAREPQEENVNE